MNTIEGTHAGTPHSSFVLESGKLRCDHYLIETLLTLDLYILNL